MKLTDEEKREMLEDGLDIKRRDSFRVGRSPRGPVSFESYLIALDDLQFAIPSQRLKRFVPYSNIKL